MAGRGIPLFEGLIARGVAAGEFRKVDPMLTVRSLVGPMVLSIIWKTVFEPIGAEKLDVRAARPSPRRSDASRAEASLMRIVS